MPISADREVEVREYDTNVDYGFTAVSRIEEDLDAQPQDRDVKKKKGTQPKKYYKQLSKDVKNKRADFFKKQDTTDDTPSSYKAALNLIKVLKLNHQFIQKNLNKCMVK